MLEKGSLKYVIAVRHGDYKDFDLKVLTERGVQQMNTLSQSMRRLITIDCNVILLSSPDARAIESANIIGSLFGIRYRVIPVLSSDRFEQGHEILDTIFPMITEYDVAILVTNYETPSGIMNSLMERCFGSNFPNQGCENGNGFFMDMIQGKVRSDLLML